MALSKMDANEVMTKIMTAFQEPTAKIIIKPSDEYGNSPGGFVLIWEEGYTDWPRMFCDMVFEEKVTVPSYVFVEPVNSGVLGIYEA